MYCNRVDHECVCSLGLILNVACSLLPIYSYLSTGAICNKSVVFLFILQVDFYRFSIAWSRVIPSGKLAAGVNEAGVTYYNNIINGLIAKGVEPVATIYHWDLPQALHDDDGGWLNEKIIPHYNDFATLCFQRFGDRVRVYSCLLN